MLPRIVRFVGIAVALPINLIVFVPSFIFGILPDLLKKRVSKIQTPASPPLAPTDLESALGTSEAIFSNHGRSRYMGPDGDVSPLLLSADSDITDAFDTTDASGLGAHTFVYLGVPEYISVLPPPRYELTPAMSGAISHHGPAVQTMQPHAEGEDRLRKDFEGYAEPHITTEAASEDKPEHNSEDDGLMMKSADSLNGAPRYERGHASGLMVTGDHGCEKGSSVLVRKKTWSNMQDALYLSSK